MGWELGILRHGIYIYVLFLYYLKIAKYKQKNQAYLRGHLKWLATVSWFRNNTMHITRNDGWILQDRIGKPAGVYFLPAHVSEFPVIQLRKILSLPKNAVDKMLLRINFDVAKLSVITHPIRCVKMTSDVAIWKRQVKGVKKRLWM